MKPNSIDYMINSSDEMVHLGAVLARVVPEGSCVFLTGPLGAGKTTLARGFVTALGHQGVVKSPTYNLVEMYSLTDVTIYHFDLYRLHIPEELLDLGVEEYLTNTSICLIEWPENGGSLLPMPFIVCNIQSIKTGRLVTISAGCVRAKEALAMIADTIDLSK